MAYHGQTISDGGVTWKVVDTRIYGDIAETPNFYARSGLFTATNTSSACKLTVPSKLLVNIGDRGYMAIGGEINLNATASWDTAQTTYATIANRAGKDFYIYVCQQDADTPKFVLSYSSTYPTGYTATNSRKIGGFHCLCANVGTISGHSLSGLLAGHILPLSIWDLKHRPVSDPEGMVWVEGLGKWIDIYLASWDSTNLKLVSQKGKNTADGGSQYSQVWHGEKFVEKFGLVGKHLPNRDEFMVFAKGSNEKTAVTGAKDKVTTGGWTDTEGRRMISNYGIEDCCGFLWQWTSDIVAFDDFLTVAYNAENWSTASVYNETVDGESDFGSSYGSVHRACVGGAWVASSLCGSRCVDFRLFSSYVVTGNGARGASEPRHFE